MDTDSLVANFDTDDENLVEFLKQKKDEFDSRVKITKYTILPK